MSVHTSDSFVMFFSLSHTVASRKEEVANIRTKFPDKIPVSSNFNTTVADWYEFVMCAGYC